MYLLLRNNKQSGPYSLEELKTMGLKAYDLVWSEGKSAAWRYPSEIEELKAFAPAVEEQPFDRFYRRPTPTTTNSTGTTLSSRAPAADAPVPVTIESSKAPGKRTIYVTMPAARNVTVTAPQSLPPRGETARPLAGSVQPVTAPIEPVREYRQPVPPVIEDYTAHQAGDRAIIEEFFPRKKHAPNVVRGLTIAVCILALLAAGIIIGLNLNKETLGFPSRVVAKVPPAPTDQAIVHPTAEHLPAPAATAPTPAADPAGPTVNGPTVNGQTNAAPADQSSATLPALTRTTKKTNLATPSLKTQKERSARSFVRANSLPPAKDSAAAMANAVHRVDVTEPYHDNQELADKEAVKAALASQVSVGANGYNVGTFGGITDLQLTVTNRSVYPLDLVIVEVQYVQANKKVYKTEDLYFRGIAAGAALMQEAPKSSRGVRVHYKIMSITSKEIAYSYSGM